MKKLLIIKSGKNEQIFPLLSCFISKGDKYFYVYFTEKIHIKLSNTYYDTVKEFLLDSTREELTINN